MKKLLLFTMLVFSLTVKASDDYRPTGAYNYHPTVVEGRTWNYVLQDYSNPRAGESPRETVYSYQIQGDSVYLGVPCKKMYCRVNEQSVLTALLYEHERRVYCHVIEASLTNGMGFVGDTEDWELLYDYSLNLDEREQHTNERLKAIEQIEADGRKFHRFVFVPEPDDGGLFPLYWIEGIGARMSFFNPTRHFMLSYISEIVSVFDGDECIFTSGDFDLPAVSTRIAPVSTFSEKTSSALYDLQGRRLTGMPQRGLYIQNGRKYIAR